MRGQQYAHSALTAYAFHRFPHGFARFRIETGGRFVENQQFGSMYQRPRYVRPAPLPARKLGIRAFYKLVQSEHLGNFADTAFLLGAGESVQRSAGREIVVYAQPLIQHGILENYPRFGAHEHRVLVEISPRKSDLTFIFRQNRGNYVYGCGFSRPVYSQKRKKLSAVDIKRNIVDGFDVSVAFAEMFYFEYLHFSSARKTKPLYNRQRWFGNK